MSPAEWDQLTAQIQQAGKEIERRMAESAEARAKAFEAQERMYALLRRRQELLAA